MVSDYCVENVGGRVYYCADGQVGLAMVAPVVGACRTGEQRIGYVCIANMSPLHYGKGIGYEPEEDLEGPGQR